MRYFFLLPAIILDFLQFFVGLAFIALQFATPVGGALGVGGLSAAYCYDATTGIVSALIAGAKCAAGGALVGAGISAFAIPIGIAIDVALSITVGGAIIMMLAMSGMFYPRVIITRMLFEVAPLLNLLPVWTNMVWKCISEKQKEEAEAQKKDKPAQQSAYTPPVPKGFSDIKPAKMSVSFVLLMLAGLATTSVAHAQVVPDPVQYIVASETPGPNEQVIIEAQGVGSFIGNANITWTKDGKVVKEGSGERTYTFTTGGFGEKTTVRVVIDSSQGFFAHTFEFNPSRINLVWEADTTVPPFYLGKALYSAGSSYKVVAFPTVYSGSSRISPNALSYQWFHSGESAPDQSGLGRYIFVGVGDQLQTGEDISVDVYYGTNKVGRGEIFIPATKPAIVLYQRDALRGVLYEQALPAAISLTANEITLHAEPYYFSAATKKSGLIPFVWELNGTETAGPDSARGVLTLRQTGSGQGSAQISVAMQNNNPDQFVQTATAAIKIVFGTEQSNSLFNFIGL